jgi:hypothetical protein
MKPKIGLVFNVNEKWGNPKIKYKIIDISFGYVYLHCFNPINPNWQNKYTIENVASSLSRGTWLVDKRYIREEKLKRILK